MQKNIGAPIKKTLDRSGDSRSRYFEHNAEYKEQDRAVPNTDVDDKTIPPEFT